MKRELVYAYYEAGRVPGPSLKTGLKLAQIDEHSDDQPNHLPCRPRGVYRKTHGRRYAPLRRALLSQVGSPWSQVFSRLAHIVPAGTLARKDILQMVRWEVKENVRRGRDGRFYCLDVMIPYLVDGLYVNPETGVLERQDIERRYPRQPRVHNLFRGTLAKIEEFRRLGPDSSAEREEGIWYRFTYALHKAGQPYPKNGKGICPLDSAKPHWHETAKRQLSSKELRVLGLRNRR